MALREVERARSPLWVSQAAAALVVLSMVLPLDGASSPHRLVILTTGALVSPPACSSCRRLVRLATGWFFSPLAGSFCSSPPAGSSRHRLFLLSTASCSLIRPGQERVAS
jgi:hypothetical protein